MSQDIGNTVRFAPQSGTRSPQRPFKKRNWPVKHASSITAKLPVHVIMAHEEDSIKRSTRFAPNSKRGTSFLDNSDDEDDQSEAIAISALASLGHAQCKSKPKVDALDARLTSGASELDETKSIITCSTYGSKKYSVGMDNSFVGNNVSEMTLDTVDENYDEDDDISVTLYQDSNLVLDEVRSLKEESKESFPNKLFQVLGLNRNADVVSWLPSGRSFVVLRPDVLVHDVLRRHFPDHPTLTQFLHHLKRWGFQHRNDADEGVIYSHRFFRRDYPSLCSQMKCLDEMSSFRNKHKRQGYDSNSRHVQPYRQGRTNRGRNMEPNSKRKVEFEDSPRRQIRRINSSSGSLSSKRKRTFSRRLETDEISVDNISRGRNSEWSDKVRSRRIATEYLARKTAQTIKHKKETFAASEKILKAAPESQLSDSGLSSKECLNIDITSKILNLKSTRASILSRTMLRKYISSATSCRKHQS